MEILKKDFGKNSSERTVECYELKKFCLNGAKFELGGNNYLHGSFNGFEKKIGVAEIF